MSFSRPVGIVLLLCGVAAGAYLTGRVTAKPMLVTADEINTVEVSRKSLPAVVRIDNKVRKDVLQPGDEPITVGSGFFYKKDRVVTNYHVIADQESLTVTLWDGRSVKATIAGQDPEIDIAVLKVKGINAPATLQFGSSSNLAAGQKLVVIGTPLRFQNFVSTGVFSTNVSGKNVPRNDTFGNELGSYVMTTASIQGGSSGGPVLDSRGAVVAVADANAASSALAPGVLGIAIPSDVVKQSLEDLEKTGFPQRGTLGITMLDLDDLEPLLRSSVGLTSSRGALVLDAPAGSAGAKAGLRSSLRNNRNQFLPPLGDVILTVDGKRVRNSFDVTRFVAAKRFGQTVKLKVWRNKKSVTLTVKLQKRTN